MKNSIFLSRLFLLSLILLLLNDFYLKAAWPGLISGKLSDFSGISLLSLFLFAWFPKYKKIVSWLIVLVFVFWKSELASPFIKVLHELGIANFNRTVDLTDLFALLVLPVCYKYSNSHENINYDSSLKKFSRLGIIFISLFAITATSYSRGVYRSEFRIQSQNQKFVSPSQAIEILNRIMGFHNNRCVHECGSNLKRSYVGSLGSLIYRYDNDEKEILIKHAILPDRSLIFSRNRYRAKYLVKIRKKIVEDIKRINASIKIKIIIVPGFYQH